MLIICSAIESDKIRIKADKSQNTITLVIAKLLQRVAMID